MSSNDISVMSDNDVLDLQTVRNAENALDALFERFFALPVGNRPGVRPAIDQASRVLLEARLALLRTGVLTTDNDLTTLTAIKQQIDNAGTAQDIILAAIRLAGFLGGFV